MEDQTDDKREPPISYRVPVGHREEFYAGHAVSGLSVSGYMTQLMFEPHAFCDGCQKALPTPQISRPRASRRPSVEVQGITRVLSQGARISDQLDDIKRVAGENPTILALLEQANAEIAAMRAANFKALGLKP